ncbi:MAG: MATE family efflux transporter [Bacteroidales bacterium]|nr:MATE family efflux transporter [Bacteroidales bacterium]MCM1147959.1 MATE family efflux transporter [Bacteroidales bacterium]MCM1206883.1 MATE family efflux transporter [Bacillota bacterium]MCM1509516.1 MATE family efflux transporter [Clostridium sp.]
MNRQILNIAIPSIISNITVPLLGLIDVAITGHLGSSAYIGAIAVGGMLFNIIYWMFAFLRMGTSGMTAQAYGRNNFKETRRYLACSLGVALAISMVLLMLTPAIRETALFLIDPSPEVGNLARIYFNICIFGAPASLGLFALNGWFIGMQNSRTPMFIAISQNIMNIIVSLSLVYGLGMKVEGVALGTVIAQWSGFGTAITLLTRRYRDVILGDNARLSDVIRQISRHELSRFFSVNKDIFLRTLCLITVHFTFIAAGSRLGDTALAVNTILMQMFTLYSYFMDGFAFAGEALAGKAIGARNKNEYSRTVKCLFVWGCIMTAAFTMTYAFAGQWLIRLLTDDESVLASAMNYSMWILMFPVCGMAAFIWDGIYIGASATRYMLLSTAAGMVMFVSLYNILYPTLQNHGLWAAFNCYLFARGAILTITRKKVFTATAA